MNNLKAVKQTPLAALFDTTNSDDLLVAMRTIALDANFHVCHINKQRSNRRSQFDPMGCHPCVYVCAKMHLMFETVTSLGGTAGHYASEEVNGESSGGTMASAPG